MKEEMKIGFVVEVPEKERGLNEFSRRLKLLKELGYDGVELAVRDPREIDEKKVKTLIEGLGLKVPAIATGKAKDFRYFREQIRFASQFKAKIIVGLIRKGIPKNDLSQILRNYEKIARAKGVELLLEPINRYEMDFINNVGEAINFIKEADLENTKILIDTFHMNIEEAWICGSIMEAGDLIGHVHVADNNRLAPGQGHLDFREILCTVADTGYNGFITVELVPVKPDFDMAARQSIEYLKPILGRR